MPRVAIKPIPISQKQLQFRQSKAWMRGFVAGRGAGKTRIGALDIILNAKDGEPYMGVSPSYAVVQETTYPTFREVAEQLGVYVKGVQSPLPKIIFKTRDGGTANIVFRSGEKPEKLRGPSKAGLWLDEASVMVEDVKLIGLPVLRHKGKMGRVIMTFTPRGRHHWTYGTFFKRVELPEGGIDYIPRKNRSLTRSHSRENPFLPPEYVDLISASMTKALAAQELAGEFVELEGLLFNRHWFTPVENAPADAMRVRYWDRAATPGGGSYTAGVLLARKDGRYYVEDVQRGQWSAHERDQVIQNTAARDALKYGNTVMIYVEQEGGSGGKEAANQMIMKLAGYPVYRDIVGGKRERIIDKLRLPGEAKIVRAMPLAGQAEAGNIYICRGPWNEEYLEELCMFPDFTYSDQVDATSGAFNKLAGRGIDGTATIHRDAIPAEFSRFGVHITRARRNQLRNS